MYGYQDSTKNVGTFGKNDANLVKFEYNPNGGKDKTAQDCIDITIRVNEKEYNKRYFPVTRAFAKDDSGNQVEVTDPKHPAFEREVKMLNAELTDLAISIAGKENTQAALSTSINSFKDFAQILERLVKGNPNWNTKNINVFLEYQFKPTGEYTRTFLQLPKNTRHGRIFSPDLGKAFKEVRTETSLKYIAEDGEVHSFTRGEWYVQSAFANVTIIETDEEAEKAMEGTGGTGW